MAATIHACTFVYVLLSYQMHIVPYMDDMKCVINCCIHPCSKRYTSCTRYGASACILVEIQQGNSTLRINSAFPVADSGSWKTVLVTRGTQNYVLAVVLVVSLLSTNMKIAHGNTKQDQKERHFGPWTDQPPTCTPPKNKNSPSYGWKATGFVLTFNFIRVFGRLRNFSFFICHWTAEP